MSERDVCHHVCGRSRFVDDLPAPAGTLYAAVVTSPAASGVLLAIDDAAARSMTGVAAVLSACDIPGQNQIGDIISDQRLLAERELQFVGEPVALVLARTALQARAAAARVELRIGAAPPVLDVLEAYRLDHTFGDERQFRLGDAARAFAEAAWVVEGEVDTQAQEHLYFETQAALALPADGDRLRLYAASQSPSAIQRAVAQVLGLPMHAVEVEVPRLGGAFGGKEEQAKPWAVLAALGAWLTGRPVRLTLNRQEDMRWTGKRHPYHSRFRLAADAQGRLLAYDVQFLQDGGAVADLSTAVLERTLFHATNAYGIPNADIRAVSCRTNQPSNTAFRGFGAPQAIFTLECAIDRLAQAMGVPRHILQERHLLAPGDRFPYGMVVSTGALRECWQRLWTSRRIAARLAAIDAGNCCEPRIRRGLALTPLCFGISFTATHLNQASVTVSIYGDGSVGVAASAVEMGQGVNDKIRAVVSRSLGLPAECIELDYTSSARAANMSPTAASVGADLNGMAALRACDALRDRLCRFAAGALDIAGEDVELADGAFRSRRDPARAIAWRPLIEAAYLARVDLVEHGFYATPDLYFDRTRERGRPFAYHVYGVSAIEASVDCLLGTCSIDRIDVVYDLGQSLDPAVDLGQMEGGLVQGVGYATIEEALRDGAGRLLTDSLATYKIPDLPSAPEIAVEFIDSASNPHGPFNAKAIGEPPFLLGLGAYFAIAAAVRSLNPRAELPYRLPLTPERVLLALYPEDCDAAGAED